MKKISDWSLLRRLHPSSRKDALSALVHVDEGMASQQALSLVLSISGADAARRRQATDLVYTALRTEIRCLAVLSRLLPHPEKLPPLFLKMLVLAVCSLLFQEHAPEHAVVNETVNDVRSIWGRGLDKVANGVLRSVQRLEAETREVDFYREKKDKDGFAAQCRFYSLPKGIGRLWLRQRGPEEALRLMQRSFERPCSGIRINRKRPDWKMLKDELLAQGAREIPSGPLGGVGVYFEKGGFSSIAPEQLSSMQGEGALSYQAVGSLLAMEGVGVMNSDRPLWDACAGFGGKTTALLEAGRNVVWSSDMSWTRLRSLPGECRRLGLDSPVFFLADASQPPISSVPGDILLDVPCSGLGVLARRPDIRRRTPDFDAYASLQERILRKACALAAKDAYVTYVTCTINEMENGSLVRKVSADGACEIEEEWQTPMDSLFEGMYGARLRVI